MKYVPPFGVSDPNASYVNGDPSIGRQGSIPPAAVFENPQREILSVIERNLIVPTDADLAQLTVAIRSQRTNYAEDTGSVNAISVAFDPPLSTYTRGLPIRVRMRNTNTGAVTINAGAGTVPVRKMNGAIINSGELPAGSIPTFVFDGSNFQVTNFGGGGGAPDVITVVIPYTVDASTTPDTVIANFSPALTSIAAGEVIAVKINRTNVGRSVIRVNALPPIELKPNGGGADGFTVQGDLHAGDVVLFLYDGQYFWFAPNPEIDAPVEYTVGASGANFPTVDAGFTAIRRKTIGADGWVTFRLLPGIYQGPIRTQHPSGDRITVRGTMHTGQANPTPASFQRSGFTTAHMNNDANVNIGMLRGKYATEIQVPNPGGDINIGVGGEEHLNIAIENVGPGYLTFQDLLITGARLPFPVSGWKQNGIVCGPQFGLQLKNVTVFGVQFGIRNFGSCYMEDCFVTASSIYGIACGGGYLKFERGGVISNNVGLNADRGSGAFITSGLTNPTTTQFTHNAQWGIGALSTSSVTVWWITCHSNGVNDFSAYGNSSIAILGPGAYGPNFSPPVHVVGNMNSIIMYGDSPQPQPS